MNVRECQVNDKSQSELDIIGGRETCIFFITFAEDDIYNILKLVFQLGYNVEELREYYCTSEGCYAATLCWLLVPMMPK